MHFVPQSWTDACGRVFVKSPWIVKFLVFVGSGSACDRVYDRRSGSVHIFPVLKHIRVCWVSADYWITATDVIAVCSNIR